MADEILNDVKKVLGIDSEYTAFDIDIIMHINSVFATLHQLGVGPDAGFMITDDTAVWDDFTVGDVAMNLLKTYVYLKVRLIFDPPQTSYLIEAWDKQAREYEWRLSAKREDEEWTPPVPPVEA